MPISHSSLPNVAAALPSPRSCREIGREMFECVGLCRSHSELREPLLLAGVETSVQLTLCIVTPPPRLFKRDRRIRTDRELALFAGESIGEIP
jgi:hypothetical protein